MSKPSYTLLVVSARSGKMKRITLSVKRARVLASLLLFVLIGSIAGALTLPEDDDALKDENFTLRARLVILENELGRIDRNLQNIETYTQKVRAITMLSDPQRNLAMGPVGKQQQVIYATDERIDAEDERMDSKLTLRMLEAKAVDIERKMETETDSLHRLHQYVEANAPLLPSTPSIRPIQSKLLTSGFGKRVDPYTHRDVMHKGVDIAAEQGSPVSAPADGMVLYAGHAGPEHGKEMVIDHGFGTQTHYAHLSAFDAKVGQMVKRGDVIARVGNTGRTTGSHLHYEVRQNGIPQDPMRYMLDF